MKRSTLILVISALLVVTMLAGCGNDSAQVAPNYVALQSDAGDYIGAGGTYSYTQANARITVTATAGHLSVTIAGDQSWTGEFQMPSPSSLLQVGQYENLQRYPTNDPALGGLDWYGNGVASNTLIGWFAIDKVTYVNGVLTAIDLRFEQHSEGAEPALHGQIHWRADDPTIPPGPVTPVPARLWQPVLGATPATGNYIYLQSDSGDYIGDGRTYTYTPDNALVTVSATAGLLSVEVSGTETWSGRFLVMSQLNQLQTGYYGGLMRYPYNNPVKGGLEWYGEGRGSNTLTGWFAIDNVTYVNGVLTAIDLRFEQHSEGLEPALHGKIHWAQ